MDITKVAIVGGTHGNEYTGPYLLKFLKNRLTADKYSTFDLTLLLANPKAYQNNVRFIDSDLNRAFLKADLNNPALSTYEANRAKVINQLLGPKGNPKTDLIIDLHTTTANMGLSIILVDNNQFNLRLAAFIQSKMPESYIYYVPSDAYIGNSDHPFLNSLARYGFALELGPIANGLYRHDILLKAYEAAQACLGFVDQSNQGVDIPISDEIEVYEHLKHVEFPLDADGTIDAVIHKSLQDRDYTPLHKGVPLFEKLKGEIVCYQETETLFPVFINEAAYYRKNIAFSLTRKVTLRIMAKE